MFIAAARARKSILRNFQTIGYEPDEAAWRSISMGVKRDLQARRLRPNVPIPSRRNPIKYLNAVYRETGSIRDAFVSLLHDGAWTSSGGSFRLAEQLGFDLLHEANHRLRMDGALHYLEVGGGWAGLRSPASTRPRDIASLAAHFRNGLGQNVSFHFTNLTQWHDELPVGIVEHPYVTAAGLSVLDTQGMQAGTVDILYSQAAAYFETDIKSFLMAASTLLRNGGLLIFNLRPEFAGLVLDCTRANGLAMRKWCNAGGMNGVIVAFEKQLTARKTKPRIGTAGMHLSHAKLLRPGESSAMLAELGHHPANQRDAGELGFPQMLEVFR
ncbi:hypothetical protein EN978_36595 [Mesorhizobium sp. M7A.F.Ca.US.001.04.1.1]|uniref:hypothetical protein n=1 Tax=unclassified Mesorhizobium TaxID=325217 RepID=UPI000FC9EB46|nr:MULTISPECIES: hypothetical protein [unclassified Mesorhizobium]RUY20393.1 hypothetical protein EN979_36425 [Mesorhizobium sp. M7A.F.Ca.US.001.04.2.1]RUY33577.1 hypothetical protein EN978_36595 [Mesorhizobium sp. M7A.F.Ca.US.001.04.1.1]